jgi:hypothetical protein
VAREVQADILCVQEHNLDTQQTQVRSILFNTSRQHWNRSKLTCGTTPFDFISMYKPGGTMLMTMADISGRVINQHKDKWGRWTSQTLRGTQGRRLSIVSAYQVVTDKPTSRLTTAASQQLSLLIQERDPIQFPCQALKWLEFVKSHQDRQCSYVNLDLLAQLNVDADRYASEFQTKYGACRPVSLLTSQAGAHLHLADGTVILHYDSAIRLAATYKPLLQYIKQRSAWTDTVISMIHWEAF